MSLPTVTQCSACLYNEKKITQWLEDMDFIFSWWKRYFTNECSETFEDKTHILMPPCNILYVCCGLAVILCRSQRWSTTAYWRCSNHWCCLYTHVMLTLNCFFITAAPTLLKGKEIFVETYNTAANVSCQVDVTATNPLPEFQWFYQQISKECLEVQHCLPDKNLWQTLPNPTQTIHPASGPTQTSYVALSKDQVPAFYLCRAKNALGNDSYVLKFYRRGKKCIYRPLQYCVTFLWHTIHCTNI